jgi:hypothetical protein
MMKRIEKVERDFLDWQGLLQEVRQSPDTDSLRELQRQIFEVKDTQKVTMKRLKDLEGYSFSHARQLKEIESKG